MPTARARGEVDKGCHFAAQEQLELFSREIQQRSDHSANWSETMSQRIKHDPAVRPFLANMPEAALVDLRRRVAAARWPEGDDGAAGTTEGDR
jgi:hypothetical protein